MPILLAIRLWIGKRLFGTLGPCGVRVSPRRIIKGPCDSSELEALEYVAKHTSIPVPKVFGTYRSLGRLYIEMEYVPGMDLQAAWRGLSPEQKKAIVNMVASYISQLRSLEQPRKEVVGSAGLNECLDHRIGSAPFGPFQDHATFHSFLRRHIPLENSGEVFGEEVKRCHSRSYRSCFTHADLCPRNIIVNSGKVAAIIDWEHGGWYPEYWEYTKAHFGLINMLDWYEGLGLALTRYDDELAAERALWRQCDEPGMPM
jgi:aminoglycoside phosphotransferase (APT) family kinase protein